jgi:EAL domain-containing protein (putative c-di-GMP-specific phosphodiesterase class I)
MLRSATYPLWWIVATAEDADSFSMGPSSTNRACAACKDGVEQPFGFTMAFQPIIDVRTERVFAYEALVRGLNGESASTILSAVTDTNRYAFDQHCRVKAIALAAQLGMAKTGAMLSINFMPGAVYSPAACIQLTLQTAQQHGFPLDKLMFEITEAEKVQEPGHLRSIVNDYRSRGFKIALDDFGAGYCGLNLLATFPADILKLDMALIRTLHQRPAARAIVQQMVVLAETLGNIVIAEGVETADEYLALRALGIHLMQGYLFAQPALEALPGFSMPKAGLTAAPTQAPFAGELYPPLMAPVMRGQRKLSILPNR